MGLNVEFGSLEQIFNNPLHPYTKALLRSVPVMGIDKKAELESIRGSTPDASIVFKGCKFEPRCNFASKKCKLFSPPYITMESNHRVRCWLYARGNNND
ncbi:unnamed protein product [marine sediment metagenome]|uniref:Oligopeptide/dipeptide ABC transporter C-terminal domain-containing protein n=1 Tax=marine sediment metagenome TaxID=412755 RepID=X1KDR0_9ZZZZ